MAAGEDTQDTRDNDATVVTGQPVGARGETLPPGSTVGPYLIVRLIGEGGMGSVYLAEQQSPVFRQVALKLTRQTVANPLARVWFEVERQALAQMQHPAIAQVFDAGTLPDGTPYLAMELVDGVPITRFCRGQALPRNARLELFRSVCLGVQHAHQKGVIHRDLKPDNVLVRDVDGVPQPKIIDFGIAIGDATAKDSAAYERAGTATYMSPEQAAPGRRDIDTRSDVYSLGVMLFEVLTDTDASTTTGVSIHSHADLGATLAQLDGHDAVAVPVPEALLAAAARLPPELRAVLRKALAPERADRYDSAAALAADLRAYLERRPLAAMPATRAYSSRKFVARHRLGIGASALVVLALVVGIVLALAAERRAQIESARARQVSDFISGILSGVDPDEAQGMDTKLLRKLLDRAGADAATSLASQPEVRTDIETTLADSYMVIADYKTAIHHADLAYAAWQSSSLDGIQRAHALAAIARVLSLSGEGARASQLGRQALTLAAATPADDPRRLVIEETVAWFEANEGHPETAIKRVEAAYALRLAAKQPDTKRIEDDMRAIAAMATDMGDNARAEKLQRELLARDQTEHGDDNSNTIIAAGDLAVTLLREHEFAAGEKLLRTWLPRATKLFGADHPMTMAMYSNLGGAIRQQGRNEEARPYYEKAYAYNVAKFGEDSAQTVASAANLAFLLRDTGDLAGAEARAREAVTHAVAGFAKDDGYRGSFPDLLGTILVREHRYPEAAAQFDDAWHIFTTSQGYGPHHPLAQEVVHHAIELYTAWGKPTELAAWQARLDAKQADGKP